MSAENSEAGPAANGTGDDIAEQQQANRTAECSHPPGAVRNEDPVTGADLGPCAIHHPKFAAARRGTRQSMATRAGLEVDQAAAGADSWYRSCFEQALTEAIRSGRPFGADDLVDLGLPEADNPQRIGGLLNRAAHRGRIEQISMRPSRNPSAHGRKIGVYRGRPSA